MTTATHSPTYTKLLPSRGPASGSREQTLVRYALAQAERLADLLLPRPDEKDLQTVQDAIMQAVRDGDLHQALEAIVSARLPWRQYVTDDWRNWAGEWLGKVERYILTPAGGAS